MKVEIEVPRQHGQYGFWEFDWREGYLVGFTRHGNPIFSTGFGLRGVFDKNTGVRIDQVCRKHVPEAYRRQRIRGWTPLRLELDATPVS